MKDRRVEFNNRNGKIFDTLQAPDGAQGSIPLLMTGG
jgi:hypothetical protein